MGRVRVTRVVRPVLAGQLRPTTAIFSPGPAPRRGRVPAFGRFHVELLRLEAEAYRVARHRRSHSHLNPHRSARYIRAMTSSQPAADALLALLERERAHFLAEVARVPLPLQARQLLPDRWSVVDVVEHVTRVERGVTRMFAAAQAGTLPAVGASPPMTAPLAASVVAALRDRTTRLEAPERVRPTGALAPEAALEALGQTRVALLEAYRAATPDVLDGAAYPHPFLGPLTLRAWVEMSAHHDARHARQLAELATAAGSVRAADEPRPDATVAGVGEFPRT